MALPTAIIITTIRVVVAVLLSRAVVERFGFLAQLLLPWTSTGYPQTTTSQVHVRKKYRSEFII